MELQKINVKFFVSEPDQVPLTTFIDVFHSWIQAAEGIYYDVADYSHMRAGPGVILIAIDANVSIDETGSRRGLLLDCKQPLTGSNDEKLRFVFRRALENCRKIEEEPALKGKMKFRGDEAFFFINDRLLAPNTAESLRDVRPDLEQLAKKLFGDAGFTLEYHPDPRRRFSVTLRSAKAFDVADLLRSLGAEDGEALFTNINLKRERERK